MKKALILNNAYLDIEHYLYQSRRLASVLTDMGVEVDVRRNDAFAATIEDGGRLSVAADGYDFCVYLDKDKYVPYLLERAGLRLFNRAAAVEACDDKMTTFIRLVDAGIPMPHTLPGLLCFDPNAAIPQTLYTRVEAQLGYPFVCKTSYGSLGKGVYLVEDRADFVQVAQRVKCTPHLYQRYVATSRGRDVRVIVVGGRIVAAMLRQSTHDFRSNMELGGVATPFDVPPAMADMCLRAADVLGLDYCGIDVLFDGQGYCLCEVNSNAFFGGIEATTGVDVATAYATYMYHEIYG